MSSSLHSKTRLQRFFVPSSTTTTSSASSSSNHHGGIIIPSSSSSPPFHPQQFVDRNISTFHEDDIQATSINSGLPPPPPPSFDSLQRHNKVIKHQRHTATTTTTSIPPPPPSPPTSVEPLLCASVPASDGLNTCSRYHYQPPTHPPLVLHQPLDIDHAKPRSSYHIDHHQHNHDLQPLLSMSVSDQRRASLGHSTLSFQAPPGLGAASVFPLEQHLSFSTKWDRPLLTERFHQADASAAAGHEDSRCDTNLRYLDQQSESHQNNEASKPFMAITEIEDLPLPETTASLLTPEWSAILDTILYSKQEWISELDIEVLASILTATDDNLDLFGKSSVDPVADDHAAGTPSDNSNDPHSGSKNEGRNDDVFSEESSGTQNSTTMTSLRRLIDSTWTPLFRPANLVSHTAALPWTRLAEVSGPFGALHLALRSNTELSTEMDIKACSTNSTISSEGSECGIMMVNSSSAVEKPLSISSPAIRTTFNSSDNSKVDVAVQTQAEHDGISPWLGGASIDISNRGRPSSATLVSLGADSKPESTNLQCVSGATQVTNHVNVARRRSMSLDSPLHLRHHSNKARINARRSSLITERINSPHFQPHSRFKLHVNYKPLNDIVNVGAVNTNTPHRHRSITNGCVLDNSDIGSARPSSSIAPSIVLGRPPGDQETQLPVSAAAIKKPSIKAMRKRLQRLAQHRGCLELDKILGTFVHQKISLMTHQQLVDFEKILNIDNLFGILSGQYATPIELLSNQALPLLLTFVNPKHPNLSSSSPRTTTRLDNLQPSRQHFNGRHPA